MSEDTLAMSHLQDVKDLRKNIECPALPAVANVLEDCVTHILDTRIDVRELKKYVQDELPDAIINRANGNADEIRIGLGGGRTLSGKWSVVARFVMAISIFGVAMMGIWNLAKDRGIIGPGTETMMKTIVAEAVQAEMASLNTVSPNK